MANKWHRKLMFPKDMYTLRCIEETMKQSDKGTPMMVLQFEIASPEEQEVNGEMLEMVGTKTVVFRIIYKSIDKAGKVNEEKTAKCQEMAQKVYDMFEIPYDKENPAGGFKGKLQYATVYGDKQEIRKSPSAEQLKMGVRQGDVIKHPKTGEPLLQYIPTIEEFFGLADEDPKKPF
jgi:hypothetical protein